MYLKKGAAEPARFALRTALRGSLCITKRTLYLYTLTQRVGGFLGTSIAHKEVKKTSSEIMSKLSSTPPKKKKKKKK